MREEKRLLTNAVHQIRRLRLRFIRDRLGSFSDGSRCRFICCACRMMTDVHHLQSCQHCTMLKYPIPTKSCVGVLLTATEAPTSRKDRVLSVLSSRRLPRRRKRLSGHAYNRLQVHRGAAEGAVYGYWRAQGRLPATEISPRWLGEFHDQAQDTTGSCRRSMFL